MSSNKRILPSRAALQLWKGKLTGAKKGYDLLKRKLDGLKKRFRQIMHEIIQTKKNMGQDMNDALFALAQGQYGAGDFGRVLIQSVKRASSRVSIAQTNVAGVYLPLFHNKQEQGEDVSKHLGISGGGAAIQKCKERFGKVLKTLVKIAGLQTSFVTLDEVIRVTSRRVNALENVIIPSIQDNIQYIIRELDQLEREDFFRLKKVQDTKKKHIERERMNKEKFEASTDAGEDIFGGGSSDLVF